MCFRLWIDIVKGQNFIGFVDFITREIAVDDFFEDVFWEEGHEEGILVCRIWGEYRGIFGILNFKFLNFLYLVWADEKL